MSLENQPIDFNQEHPCCTANTTSTKIAGTIVRNAGKEFRNSFPPRGRHAFLFSRQKIYDRRLRNLQLACFHRLLP